MSKRVKQQLRRERLIRNAISELYGTLTATLLCATALLLYCGMEKVALGAFVIFILNVMVICKYDL